MGEDSVAVGTLGSLLFRPILSRSGKDLWEEPRAGFLGGQGRRAHTATLENQRAQLLNQEPRWGGRLGTPSYPRQHACLQAAVTYPPQFKVQAAQFPWIPDPAPTPSSAGPDSAKQRFTGSPAVTIPRASPPRRNREDRIISDIISLILNEALWPQLPASPLSFCRP